MTGWTARDEKPNNRPRRTTGMNGQEIKENDNQNLSEL
jgi:hypothetical protein